MRFAQGGRGVSTPAVAEPYGLPNDPARARTEAPTIERRPMGCR